MRTPGTNSGDATRRSSARCNSLLAAVVAAALFLPAAAAPAAAQHSLGYSSYLDGPAVIAAGPDDSVIAVSRVSRAGRGFDIQIVRFDAATHAASAPTFVGGAADDYPLSVAVAQDGTIWISGATASSDFPLVNPLQTGLPAGSTNAFLMRLAADRTTILFSTFFAIGLSSEGGKVVATPAGTVVWTGLTTGGGVPTTAGVFQPGPAGGREAFLAGLTGQGGLIAASYFGGSGDEWNSSIAVGADGAIYVGGATDSKNFATTPGAFQAAASSRSCLAGHFFVPCQDGFIARVRADLGGLDYLTYLHGNDASRGHDQINAIAVNAAGEAYVTGTTWSDSFPTTAGAFQTGCRVCASPTVLFGIVGGDAFVTRLNTSGTALVYSTFLSGQTDGAPDTLQTGQSGKAIALDDAGRVFVAGITTT